jgi:peptidoglycan lytic transglycosylase G
VNGSHGGGGSGRGTGRGSGGRQEYGGRGQPRRQAGAQPPWDNPAEWPDQDPGQDRGQGSGQSSGQPQGPGQGYRQGYGAEYGQGYGAEHGQGYGAEYGQGYGQQDPWPDPRSTGQRPGEGAQHYPPAGPQSAGRGGQQPGPVGRGVPPGWQGTDPQQTYGGTGPRPAQRGGGPQWQVPGGYDPRGTAPRHAADGYPGGGYPSDDYPGRGDARHGQEGYPGWGAEPRRDEEFLPGFGSGGFDNSGTGRGRGGGYPDQAGGYAYGDDRRGTRGRGQDVRGGDLWDDGRRRRRRGPVRRLAPWIALLVILTPLVIGGLYVYHLYENKVHPADYSGAGTVPTVTVQVKSGDTATSLAPRLVSLGVVASSRAFILAAENSKSTATLEVGFYKLKHHMQSSIAYAALLNPKNRVQNTLTFPEGLRLSQLLARLGAHSGIPLSDFQKVLASPAQLGLPSYAHGKPEGYLFPATYVIQPNDTALTILKAMVRRFDQEAAQVHLATAARGVHLTPTQVIVVASLVQAEGGRVQDYPKIAEVVYNRLAKGMQLQFDSTVFYGLGKYGTVATAAQINTPGPYNTYLHAGLPPGPIDSPGNAAIQAALHPAHGNLLYFVGLKNGVTEFSPNPISR